MEFLQFNENLADQNFIGGGGAVIVGGNKRRKSCNYSSGSDEFHVPVRQRSQANARERDRTQSVNTAFSTLRTLIPTEPKDRKLSKIETLRLASSYISHLGTQLMAGSVDQPCLRPSKLDDDASNTNTEMAQSRHQVCTFCIAHKKSSKNGTTSYEYVSNFDGQIFLNPTSPIASAFLTSSGDDINGFYYQ